MNTCFDFSWVNTVDPHYSPILYLQICLLSTMYNPQINTCGHRPTCAAQQNTRVARLVRSQLRSNKTMLCLLDSALRRMSWGWRWGRQGASCHQRTPALGPVDGAWIPTQAPTSGAASDKSPNMTELLSGWVSVPGKRVIPKPLTNWAATLTLEVLPSCCHRPLVLYWPCCCWLSIGGSGYQGLGGEGIWELSFNG